MNATRLLPELQMTRLMTPYPEIAPFQHGWLNCGDGHQIYYEQCGNPDGLPAVVLHGGPGSGCTPAQRRFFDPDTYRIILFDQRGCGRSQPAGGTEHNTTWHLVADIELLRQRLGIERWLVFGGSWGSTLALAYAAMHKAPVLGLVLRGIFLSRPEELRWFLEEARKFFPEAWSRLVTHLDADQRKDIMGAYAKLVSAEDVRAAAEAARTWNAYEGSIISLLPANGGSQVSDAVSIARARVQLHYLTNQCFLQARPLLDVVEGLRDLPAVIIQGRYDMVCPPLTAYELHRAWPEAEFVMVPDAGHAAFEPGICDALIRATEQFKGTLSGDRVA